MKKIIIDKNDGIAEVIDAILGEPDPEITLVVPNHSALGKSMRNFNLLKREMDGAGKTVAIESVDETILVFAKESHIEASHPLWRGIRSGAAGVSDIVSRPKKKGVPVAAAEPEDEAEEYEEARGAGEEDMDEDADADAASEADLEGDLLKREELQEAAREARSPFFSRVSRRFDRHDRADDADGAEDADGGDDDDDDRDDGSRSGGKGKIITWTLVAVIVLLCGVYAANSFFDHATITVNFKKTPWTDQLSLTADKSASADDLGNGVIGAQVFTSNKNITETFHGSSVQQVSQKAQGTITIYNDYSTATQELVATTRFLTPDGKIFRITQKVMVPGATKAANGTLTPSSITAPIVADQAGPDYNIGPVAKLTIPGFAKDAAREAGFYGTITASTTGGFVGQRAVPTAADITAAKASTTAILQAALQGGFSGSYPNNFKILDGATQVQVGTLTVNTSTDENGNFTVFGQATLEAIGFDETALKNDLLAQAQSAETSSVFSDINLTYSNVSADFTNGRVSFSLAAQGDLEPQLSVATLQGSVLGKSVSDARSAIEALPELASAEISVWPSWLSTIPADPQKVHITIN